MERTAQHADKELLARTRPFAVQDTARAGWNIAATFGALVAAVAIAAAAPWWPLRVVGTLVEALVLVTWWGVKGRIRARRKKGTLARV